MTEQVSVPVLSKIGQKGHFLLVQRLCLTVRSPVDEDVDGLLEWVSLMSVLDELLTELLAAFLKKSRMEHCLDPGLGSKRSSLLKTSIREVFCGGTLGFLSWQSARTNKSLRLVGLL